MRILSTLALFGMATGSVWACSCTGPGSPCSGAGRSAAVFTGTVLDFKTRTGPPAPRPPGRPTNAPDFPTTERVARIWVGDALSGVPGGQTIMEVSPGDGSCAFTFEVGKDYVVYAYMDDAGQLKTSMCSRTALLEKAKEDIAYFGKMASAPDTTELRVRAERDVTILAEGPAGRYSGKTDNTGTATFQVAAGEYSIHQEADGNLPDDPKIRIGAKGCADVMLQRNLEITGRVIGKDGRPVARVSVEMVSSKGEKNSTSTNVEGQYQMKISRAGEYQLGINLTREPTADQPYPRWFYPGTDNAANALKINFNGRPETRTYDFALPEPLAQRKVEGVLRFAGGEFARYALVYILDSSHNQIAQLGTDGKGHFQINVLASGTYRLHATGHQGAPISQNDQFSAVPKDITPGDAPVTLDLVLDQPGNSVTALR